MRAAFLVPCHESRGGLMHTLISAVELAQAMAGGTCLVLDCRFSLQDADAGRAAYERGHVPGERYVHTNEDLSARHLPGLTGRHPLPARETWMRRVASWGLSPEILAVAYDDAGGPYAARLWWMLRWIGHEKAAVLDGGWQAWLANGGAQSGEGPSRQPSGFDYSELPSLTRTIDAAEIEGGDQLLLDAREGRRFLGEVEPIDPVAGHIPGARCSPFMDNLRDDGHFKSPQALREKFRAAGAGQAREVVSYCGSGVTATHNILAMRHAGLPEPLLYPGSWSEWILDPERGIATGDG